MIYIKRFLWALGWVPMFIIGLILCLVSIFSFPFIAMFYYIKSGDVETTPDKFLPMCCTLQLENKYRKLEPKSRKKEIEL
jgi:hypothetical protein